MSKRTETLVPACGPVTTGSKGSRARLRKGEEGARGQQKLYAERETRAERWGTNQMVKGSQEGWQVGQWRTEARRAEPVRRREQAVPCEGSRVYIVGLWEGGLGHRP